MKNKVVVVTGASSGIGKATAMHFAENGAKLLIVARNREKLATCAAEIKAIPAEVLEVVADVSIKEDCKRVVDECIAYYGQMDVLINNAGISMRAIFEKAELSVIEKVMQVNFWGGVYCTKFALPHLLKTEGSIVAVSSIAGYVGLPARTGYSASKFAMHGFFEALRAENLEKNLHVLIACPGFTASNIRNTALKADGNAQGQSPRKEEKMMSAEEVADTIYRAVKKRKPSIVLTTEGKMAVFLKKFFPNWIQQMVFNKLKKEENSPLS